MSPSLCPGKTPTAAPYVSRFSFDSRYRVRRERLEKVAAGFIGTMEIRETGDGKPVGVRLRFIITDGADWLASPVYPSWI
jgi:hypothetical protein